MINYFSTSVVSRYIFLFLFVIYCWLTSINYPVLEVNSSGLLFPELIPRLGTLPLVSFFITFAVYLASIFMLNYIAVKQHITGLISLLTMLFYILITASFTSYFSFNLLAWVSLLLIVVLFYTLTLHNREDSIKNAFNAGFFLGIGSVLFPPLVYLIFIVWISILLHRENNWRAYVSSILGLSAPFVFVLTWFFLNDKLLDAILVLKEELIPQLSFPDWSVKQAVLFGILFLFGSVISLKILGSLGEKNINLRRNLLVLVTFFAFITLITLLFIKSVLAYILAAIPLALLTANLTDKSKPNKWVNWGLSVLTLVIIVFHLIGFLNAN